MRLCRCMDSCGKIQKGPNVVGVAGGSGGSGGGVDGVCRTGVMKDERGRGRGMVFRHVPDVLQCQNIIAHIC